MKRRILYVIYVVIAGCFCYITYRYFQFDMSLNYLRRILDQPIWLIGMIICYLFSFMLKAAAWKWYVSRQIPFSLCLYALFYSLFVNHLLPVKAGDALRIGILAKKQQIRMDEAVHSVLVMRILDLSVLAFVSIVGALIFGILLSLQIFVIILCSVVAITIFIFIAVRKTSHPFWRHHLQLLQTALQGYKGWGILALVTLSWFLETSVLWGIAYSTGTLLHVGEAFWVNSLTIAGQVFHFTPGAIGTYESTMSFLLMSRGLTGETAYHIALMSHGFKFVFSYAVGFLALAVMPLGIKEWIVMLKKKGIKS
jgi:uncharacterized membrane protein YbhN (UPF0104 family)